MTHFLAYGTFSANCAPIFRQDLYLLRMYRNELTLDPCHVGVPSGASKLISNLWYVQSKPCPYPALTITCLQTDRNEIPHDPHQLGLPSHAFKMIFEPMVGANRKPILHRDYHYL
jgi:hypothetical protein